MGLFEPLYITLMLIAIPFAFVGYPIYMPFVRLWFYLEVPGSGGDEKLLVGVLVAVGALLSCCSGIVFFRSLWTGKPSFHSGTIREIDGDKRSKHGRHWYGVKFLLADGRLEVFPALRFGTQLADKIRYKMKKGFSCDLLVSEDKVYAVGEEDDVHYFTGDLLWTDRWSVRALKFILLVMTAYYTAGLICVGMGYGLSHIMVIDEGSGVVLVGWFTISWISTFVVWAILKQRSWRRRCRQAAEAIGEYRTAKLKQEGGNG